MMVDPLKAQKLQLGRVGAFVCAERHGEYYLFESVL